ncbi:unnamed protein product [Lactuca saligna]|uniref:Ubiquitin-like protease family profile domain-containing protein n=1 Tax=Lactuca saligna TaxID=75948 RepID=A0AA36A2D8_LACSI|nr:unnamed protein product [Lactuca saligna]
MDEHSVKLFHNSPFPNLSIGMTQEFADIISNSPLKDIMKTPKTIVKVLFHYQLFLFTVMMLMSAQESHPRDELFRTCAGVAAERFHMESFFPKCELFGHVLDCWSHLLNFDEDLRSNLSTRRLFATTTLTPCEFHIFLVVLDFQQPAFWIIDNIKRDVDTHDTYGLLPDIIHSYMSKYLRNVHHPNVKAFSHVPRQIPQLSWSTVNTSTDCGTLTMRHMETFMGGNIRDFKTGFKLESLAHENQLSRLRVIYLCKIINSDYNLLKESILHQVTKFQKLNASNRKQLLKDAATRIHDRLTEFG